MNNNPAIYCYAGKDGDAVHPKEGQQEAGDETHLFPKLPAELSSSHQVHRDAVEGHGQLGDGDVHEEKIELRLELQHDVIISSSHISSLNL